MPAKCQLHRRGSQIEPVPLNNGPWDTMPRGRGGKGASPLLYRMFRRSPLLGFLRCGTPARRADTRGVLSFAPICRSVRLFGTRGQGMGA